jgi:tmRNA-binding protein
MAGITLLGTKVQIQDSKKKFEDSYAPYKSKQFGC